MDNVATKFHRGLPVQERFFKLSLGRTDTTKERLDSFYRRLQELMNRRYDVHKHRHIEFDESSSAHVLSIRARVRGFDSSMSPNEPPKKDQDCCQARLANIAEDVVIVSDVLTRTKMVVVEVRGTGGSKSGVAFLRAIDPPLEPPTPAFLTHSPAILLADIVSDISSLHALDMRKA